MMEYRAGTKLVIEEDGKHIGRATVLSNGRVMVFGGKCLGQVMGIKEWYQMHEAKEAAPEPEVVPEPEPVPELIIRDVIVPEPPKKTCLDFIRHALICH